MRVAWLAEPDLRIAATALAADMTLVTGNIRIYSGRPPERAGLWGFAHLRRIP
ncbi:MAG: hypothetical protein ACRDIF_04125 [Actinomycetota bacterium]